MTTYGYCRCSTESQSLESQQATLKNAGCEKIFGEKESGIKTNRAELMKVIKRLQAGDLVVVTALDRLGRSLKDVLNVLDLISNKGAKFRSIKEPFFDSSSHMGQFLIQIIGSVAQLERSLIIQRTSEGRKRAIARGVIMGRKPKLNAYQRTEAVKRHENGEFMSDIARSYNVSTATICRLIQQVTN